MIVFQVTYTMRPGQRAEFLKMVRKTGILDAVRKERGCLSYRYYLPEEDDGITLLLVEQWVSPEDQKAHMKTSHMAEMGRRKESYVAETRVISHAVE